MDRNALGGLGGAAPQGVALRKESVDRNGEINARRSIKVGRSPQGERG